MYNDYYNHLQETNSYETTALIPKSTSYQDEITVFLQISAKIYQHYYPLVSKVSLNSEFSYEFHLLIQKQMKRQVKVLFLFQHFLFQQNWTQQLPGNIFLDIP